jgi:hypothetical protein
VFRRRRREDPGRSGIAADQEELAGDEQPWDESAEEADEEFGADFAQADADQEAENQAGLNGAADAEGPWDADDDYPQQERVDFGSLLVPVAEGFEIQLNIAEDQGPVIAVLHGDSAIQLQAFAAPKSGGLWEDVRQEIMTALAEGGGRGQEAHGRFGPELRARVPVSEAGAVGGSLQPIRFLGVDGPRWFVRGVLTGPAAEHDAPAAPLEEIFAGVVVVRGDHPAPPRDLLEIRLPEEARQAMEEQMQEQEQEEGGRFGEAPNPFERGPEITEIR